MAKKYLSLYWLLTLLLSPGLHGQENTDEVAGYWRVSGVVKDAYRTPIPGVNIVINGTARGTITDAEGKFQLRLPAADTYTLIFSFVGYETRQLAVSGNTENLQIVLEERTETLEGVVITGYNVGKNRTELVGSLSELESKEIPIERPEETFEKMLAGQIAGLRIENPGGGEAGLPVSVRIRGQSTLPALGSQRRTSSGEPLYILDGVPLYDISEGNTVIGFEQRLNPLAAINPADIASITVLKDAAASAIYGANAANGVILITTKRGQSGGLKVDAAFTHGISNAINNVTLLNSEQYVDLYRETLMNDGFTEEEATEMAGSADVYTAWEDISLRTAHFTNANVSLSAGSEKTASRLSFNYLDQETIAEGNKFLKFGSRANVDYSFNDAFKVDFNGSLTIIRKESLGGFFDQNFPPNLSPFNADGTFNNSGLFAVRPNPLATLAQNDNNHKSFATTNSFRLSYKPLATLQFTGLAGIDYYQNRHTIYQSAFNASGNDQNGRLNIVDRQNFKWITNLTGRWGTTVSKKHNISVLAGFEAQEQVTDLIRGLASDFPFDRLRTLQSAEDRDGFSQTESVTSVSYFGELSYDFKQKYFLSVNARNDASSVFGGDVRRAVFASIGASWNISTEPFMNSLDFIDLLKLRTSYGSTGNSKIGSYTARGLYQIDNSFNYGNEPGIYPTTPENPNLTWEKNFKFDAGLDVVLFDRLNIIVDYYNNQTIDAIVQVSVPFESGFDDGDINAADLVNKGWEFTMGYDIIKKTKLSWNARVNLATNRNEITKLNLQDFEFIFSTGVGYRVGEDARTIYGALFTGVDPETGLAMFQLADGALTPDYDLANDPEHIRKIGSGNPTAFGGITNQVDFGPWSLSFLMSYTFGADILVSNFYETDGRQIEFLNQSINQLDRWQNPGDVTNTPRLSRNNEPYSLTNRYIYNDDHVKFENVMISYRLSNELLSTVGLASASVFLQGTNLGYLYFGEDTPDDRNGVAEYKFRFPEARTFTAGINISF